MCRQWSQVVYGDEIGRFDFWRHVSQLQLNPSEDRLIVSIVSSGQSEKRTVIHPNWETALHALLRVRALSLNLKSYACICLLDLLLPPAPSLSSTRSYGRVRLDHLDVFSGWSKESKQNQKLIASALSRCLLRCPPLRCCMLHVDHAPSIAALRHVAGSGRLMHLELFGDALSAMVWGEAADERGPRQRWMKRLTVDPPEPLIAAWTEATVQSLGLLQANLLESFRKTVLTIRALAALPALTHLYMLPQHDTDNELQYIAQHLGDRLTFLSLRIFDPLPTSFSYQCIALQSLHFTVRSWMRGVLLVSECLHLLPRLSELMMWDERKAGDVSARGPTILPVLPQPGAVRLSFD